MRVAGEVMGEERGRIASGGIAVSGGIGGMTGTAREIERIVMVEGIDERIVMVEGIDERGTRERRGETAIALRGVTVIVRGIAMAVIGVHGTAEAERVGGMEGEMGMRAGATMRRWKRSGSCCRRYSHRMTNRVRFHFFPCRLL
jgi:hypothetical protein